MSRPYIAFDIETVPMPGCEAYLTDPIEAPVNYKDPAKIAAFIAEKRTAQIEGAGLDLDLCEIAAIAVSANDFTVVQHGGRWDERKSARTRTDGTLDAPTSHRQP